MDLMIIRHIHGLAKCVASLGKGAVSLLLLLSVSFLPALWQEHCRSVSIWKWTEVRTTYTFHPPWSFSMVRICLLYAIKIVSTD